jgi:glucose/arabinose dehydrogenase
MRTSLRLAACLTLVGTLVAQAPPPGFRYQLITDGALSVASAMAFAPDGRLFVCERLTGRIRVIADGVLQPGAWATVPCLSNAATEQGLLGIAVDPGFLSNRFVYVYYTTADGLQNRIARLQEVGGVGTSLTVLSPANAIPTGGATIHNGGRMVFGFDGKLYVGTGDRSVSTLAPQRTSWNGKVLRFDVPNLTVPIDNPFAGSPVWSLGHRNQFGLAVHPVTGGLFQTENGQSFADEVNRIVRGGDYGWPTYEGTEPAPNPATIDPLYTWSPTPDLTGTCFYSGANYPPNYANDWFVGEFSAGVVHRLELNPSATAVTADAVFDDLGQVYDLQMGPDGNVWVLHNDLAGVRGGDEVGRWVHDAEPIPSVNLTAVSNRSVGGAITFGWHGQQGDLFLGWAASTALPSAVATIYGAQWVPIEIVLPTAIAQQDQRAYLGLPITNAPALIGLLVHTQAACFRPTDGSIALTNRAVLTLH